MWKKPEAGESEREAPNAPAAPTAPDRTESRKGSARATIGPSISIQGDVTGEEDLLIQGRIEGKVDLKQHNVTIGPNGKVKADVFGRTVTVEGEVEGSLFGGEQIVLRQSARVRGNITAPRVTLEDGAAFKGSIDMDSKGVGRAAAPPRPASGPVAGSTASTASAAPDKPDEPARASKGG